MTTTHDPNEKELSAIKARLKSGKLDPTDLRALKTLVERTELAAKNLRAAIVE
jgi:hypothetical protein